MHLPQLVGGAGECVHALEARRHSGNSWSGSRRYLQQDTAQLPQVVQVVRPTCVHRTAPVAPDRHICRIDLRISVQAGVHVNYQETVLPIRDGLPKFTDVPSDMGGSGTLIPE